MMLAESRPTVLIASHDPALLAAVEPLLAASGLNVRIALSSEQAHTALISGPLPDLTLLDTELPGTLQNQLISAAREVSAGYRSAVVLLADRATDEWAAQLQEGTVDDLIPRSSVNPHWRIRLQAVLRTYHRMRDVERVRAEAAHNAEIDPLTGVSNRSTMLSLLFRETDRVQRMRTPLCLLLMDVDDFGHWNERLGTEACDALLCGIVGRSQQLLRSYDVLGRAGKDEFLMMLPGCAKIDAVVLAERLRSEVFAKPFRVADEVIRLSACFGISASDGRSPVVVLREAEMSLQAAKETGPESIQCFNGNSHPRSPVTFLSAGSGDRLLAW